MGVRIIELGGVRRLAALALVALAGCEAAAPGSVRAGEDPADVVRVAFLKDLSVPDADEHALPAVRAAALAFETASLRENDAPTTAIELDEFDLGADPGALDAIAADSRIVGLIVAPGVDGGEAADVDVPVVSLSGLGAGGVRGSWIRMVPPLATAADVLGARFQRSAPCVLSEAPPPDPLFGLVSRRLPDSLARAIDPMDVEEVVREADCGTVIWAGGPDGAAIAAEALASASVRFVGGDRLLDPDFLSVAGEAAEGAFALCACTNLSTSTELAVRRFIQDYQSEHGVAPGAYAVEAWDAAHLFLRAVGDGSTTRARVARSIRAVRVIEGLGGTFRVGSNGEPVHPRALLRLYRVEGGRWVRATWGETGP